ncbi:energy-coupling factor ABC transporter ATP-binding protein [Corynebacterium xerosis]|uniref:energy-coupling factor ABC transporter ATP-binding protein n=1 Tax=Corynebacterium xerosis TaxID=1725 RepID=UPI001E4DE8F7|nr:ABC transporter ATP-binding protein [Corynebacterium xerosis]
MSILAARGIGFRHPGVQVLSDVDLEVFARERLALLGANGSGKSTLLRLMAGAIRPTSGHLEFDGSPCSYGRRGRNDLRRRVQLVLQDPDDQLFATSVAADVSYGPVNQGLPEDEVRARVDEAMAAVEVADLADRVPHQLSYGQRKRVALAGALAMRPDVLLLDEPTAGLDPAATRNLLGTLAGLHDRGVAVVMATHDVDVAWAFAARAAVLVDGGAVTGDAADVLLDPVLARRARLSLPWAPMVARALGRHPATIHGPDDLLDQ